MGGGGRRLQNCVSPAGGVSDPDDLGSDDPDSADKDFGGVRDEGDLVGGHGELGDVKFDAGNNSSCCDMVLDRGCGDIQVVACDGLCINCPREEASGSPRSMQRGGDCALELILLLNPGAYELLIHWVGCRCCCCNIDILLVCIGDVLRVCSGDILLVTRAAVPELCVSGFACAEQPTWEGELPGGGKPGFC